MKKILFTLLFISTLFIGYTDVTIGNGTETGERLPIEPYYGYSYSQVIYLQSEIAAAGDITELSWHFAGSSLSNSNDWTIYIGHTTKSEFSSTSDWIDVSTLTQVWSGTFTDPGTSGWITFDITDFTYNNTDNLVIAVDENASGYDGSSDDFYCTAVSENRGIEYHNDYTNPDPASPPTGSLKAYIANVILGGITQSCPSPSAQTVTNITSNSADLGWTAGGTEPNWNIEWGPSGFSLGSGTLISNTSSNPYTLSGLSSGTNYDWYVQADCDGTRDESAWVGPNTFTTLCAAEPLPISEDFDGVTTPDLPNCWSMIDDTGNSYSEVATTTSYPHSSPNCVRIYNSSATTGNLILISPESSHSADGTRVKFWARTSSGDQNLLVGTMSDPTDPATFTTIQTISINATYTEYTVYLSGTDNYVAFKHAMDGTYETNYIDDFTWEETPSCLEPSDLTASNITSSSADLSWTDNNTPAATSWDIELGVSGFTPTGTPTQSGVTNPYTYTGLTEDTYYDWYVRANCGSRDDSPWSGPHTFHTACAAITSFPWTDGFEGDDDCWTIIDNNSDGDMWNTDYTANPHSGSEVAMLYTDFNSGNNDDYLITPQIALTGNQRLKYWYRVESSNEPNDFEVLLSTTGTDPSNFTDTLLTLAEYSNTTYMEETIDLSAYSTDVYIAFHVPSGGLDGWRLYIDDVTVEDIPSCPEPTDLTASNITTTTADLSWTENGSATSWDIELGLSGFTPTGTPTQSGVTNPYTYTGLTENTTYDWYVRADCGGTRDESAWAGPNTFITACSEITSFPYNEGFEGSTENCWTVIDNNGDGDMWDMDYASNPHSGSEVAILFTDYNYGNNDDYLITPQIALTGNQRLKYWYRVQSSGEPNDFEVLLSTTGTDPSNFTDTLLALAEYSNTTYMEETIDLSAYSTDVYIAFHVPSGGLDGWRLYIDDVTVEDIPSCLAPSDQVASNLLPNSADLSWTENGSATSWDIELGASGFTPTGTPTQSGVTNPYTYTGLTENTTYDWYVRADCGANGTSSWVGPNTFTTPCNAISSFPYTETFDGLTNSSPGYGCTADGSVTIGDCWSNYVGDDIDWDVFSGSTGSSGTGPSDDVTGGGKYLYTESSSCYNSTGAVISPIFDVSSLTTPFLTFYYHMYGTDMGTLTVYASTDNGSTWTSVWTLSGDQGNSWNETSLNLGAYSGSTALLLKFEGVTGSDFTSDMAIDEITLEEAPACPDPTSLFADNITKTTADLNWTEIGSATLWNIEIGAPGFTPGTGAALFEYTGISSNPYTATGLTEGTDYEFYVQSDCGGSRITSNWSGPASFTTLRTGDVITDPIIVTFTNGTFVDTTQNSCNFIDNYDLPGSDNKDLVYQFTISSGKTASVSLRYSDYDTKLAVYSDTTAVPGATNYLYYNDDYNGWTRALQSGIYCMCLPAGTYNVVVDGYSSDCGNVHIQIDIEDLGIPANVVVEMDSTTTDSAYVKISWDAMDCAARYHVYRSTDPYSSFTEIATTNLTYYQDVVPAGDTKYFYYVTTECDEPTGRERTIIHDENKYQRK